MTKNVKRMYRVMFGNNYKVDFVYGKKDKYCYRVRKYSKWEIDGDPMIEYLILFWPGFGVK